MHWVPAGVQGTPPPPPELAAEVEVTVVDPGFPTPPPPPLDAEPAFASTTRTSFEHASSCAQTASSAPAPASQRGELTEELLAR